MIRPSGKRKQAAKIPTWGVDIVNGVRAVVETRRSQIPRRGIKGWVGVLCERFKKHLLSSELKVGDVWEGKHCCNRMGDQCHQLQCLEGFF